MSVRTCAVVVKHRDAEHAVACVASLASSETPVKTVVVDNTPQDDRLDEALAGYAGVEVLHPQTNLGFAGGCNLGIERARTQPGCEFVLLLHEDVRVQPDTLAMIEDAMDERPEVGLVTCRVVYMHDPARLFYARGRIDWRTARGRIPGFGRGAMAEKALRGGFMSYAPACTMLLRRAVLEKVGKLDTRFRKYEDGVDLSQTTLEAGYRIYYCADTFVEHRARCHRKTDGSPSADRVARDRGEYREIAYHRARNAVMNARKHAHGRDRLVFLAMYPAFFLVDAIRASRRFGADAFRPAWRGLVAGIREPLRPGADGGLSAT